MFWSRNKKIISFYALLTKGLKTVQKILVPVANENGANGLVCGLSLHLHPYFVNVSSEGSGESVHLHWLAQAYLQ